MTAAQERNLLAFEDGITLEDIREVLEQTAGYAIDQVPRKKCLMCNQLIGDARFNEVRTLARFGQMLFVHADCDGTEQ